MPKKKIEMTAAPTPPAARTGLPAIEKAKRFLQSRDVSNTLVTEVPDLTPPERGPMTGERQLTDVQYVERYSLPSELAIFRAAVESRRHRDGSVGWRHLPSGIKILNSMVLGICDRCGHGIWVKEASGPDPVCNFQRRVDGGHLRLATIAEEKAWFKREEAIERKRRADAPKRAAELAEFNKRHLQDLPRDKDGRL